MRAGSVALLAVIAASAVGPARAQYAPPLIGGWLLPSQPVAPSAPKDAGAENGDAQQSCGTIIWGRQGLRPQCAPAPQSTPTNGKK
jgi:hypothetical protein